MDKKQKRDSLIDMAQRLEAAGKTDFAMAYLAGMLDAEELRRQDEKQSA